MANGLPPTGDYLEQLRLLERRVKKIETKNRGRVEYYNQETGLFETGSVITDTDANIIHLQNDEVRGAQYPHDHTQWIVPTSTSISDNTERTLAECELQVINGDLLQFSGALIIPSGTTADVSIYDATTATYVTQSQAGAISNFICEWLHPYTVGWGGNGTNAGLGASALISYRVQRTAGSGTIVAFPPRSLMIRNSRFTSNESATTPFTFN